MYPPHVAQRLHHRHPARLFRGTRPIQGAEQDEPVRANLKGKRLALFLALRQMVIFDPAPIALEPNGLGDGAQPVRHDSGQVVQSGAQRFGHQLKQVQVVHGA